MLRAVPPSLTCGFSYSAGHQSSQQEGEEFEGRREIMGARPRSSKRHFRSRASGENIDTVGTCLHVYVHVLSRV